MLRLVLKKIPADYLKSKAADDDIVALQDFRAQHPDNFLHQLTDLAQRGSHVLLPGIEHSITGSDRSHYILMHAINGDRTKLQNEYELIPENRRLQAKLIIVEGSARGGHIDFAKEVVATFPSGYDIEDDDEKISDIMARIAALRGYAQNKSFNQDVILKLMNDDLHVLIEDLDRFDYDYQDRVQFQLYAYEHIITGFYLSGLFENQNLTLSVLTSLNYISLRYHLALAYENYHEIKVGVDTFKLSERIRGVMLDKKCSFTQAKLVIDTNENSEYINSMRLFAYKSDRLDPERKGYSPKYITDSPRSGRR